MERHSISQWDFAVRALVVAAIEESRDVALINLGVSKATHETKEVEHQSTGNPPQNSKTRKPVH